MRRFVVLFACVAVVGAAVAGLSFAGVKSPERAAVTTNVIVHMTEYAFQLDTSTAPVGTVVFSITNDGKAPHNFSIAGQTSDTLAAGGTATMTVTFTQAGVYNYVCTLPGHAAAGMQGNFTVTGGTPPPTKPTATLKATLSEFKIVLKTTSGKKVKSVKHGLIRFKVTNVGKIPHNFVIGGQQSPILGHGKSATVNVVLKKGKKKFVCSVTGHAALGMKGTLLVT
jgi:plastocyanin